MMFVPKAKIALLALLFAFAAVCVRAATEEEIEAYPEHAVKLEEYGYDWKPFKVQTEDGWILTVWRVWREDKLDKEKLPLLLVHGSMDSSLGYFDKSPNNEAWCLQMVDHGYQIWLINLRGTDYSKEHIRDGDDDWSLREKWSFTWAESGVYDIPPVVDLILEETKAPKITLVAHSQGTSSMWYGLAHKQDFYAEKLHRFIALASCVFPEAYDFVPKDFYNLIWIFLKAD